jgi:hypothetical protein
MAAFRADGTTPEGREVFTDTNPYGSRTLVVARDEASSVAYLCDSQGAVRGAVWLANHGMAPEAVDLNRLNAGLPPVMPRQNTRHPSGRPPIDPAALEVLWFEEGDGVALFEHGRLLAVIPGWADMGRGMPGYALDAIGETPFAWSLEEAMEGLAPRVAKARSYWEWRRAEGSWASYRQFVMGHLDDRLGAPGRYWEISGDRMPTVGVTERPPAAGRDYGVLSTVGMSCQRMPQVELYIERPDTFARVELAVATRGEARDAARLFLWLAQYPWHSVTWLGHGHTARWYHSQATFPLRGGYNGVLLLADLPHLPDLTGFAFGGDVVKWLWLIPVTDAELRAAGHGYEFLADRVAARLPV